jgi:hypothetical protein
MMNILYKKTRGREDSVEKLQKLELLQLALGPRVPLLLEALYWRFQVRICKISKKFFCSLLLSTYCRPQLMHY